MSVQRLSSRSHGESLRERIEVRRRRVPNRLSQRIETLQERAIVMARDILANILAKLDISYSRRVQASQPVLPLNIGRVTLEALPLSTSEIANSLIEQIRMRAEVPVRRRMNAGQS